MSWYFKTFNPAEHGFYSKQVQDYLSEKPGGSIDLYPWPSSLEKIPEIVAQKQFSKFNRALLVEVLKQQALPDLHAHALQNIELLLQENTYTITTGHQLNLASGPFYTIAKVLTILALTKKVNHKFPHLKAVPVFWMASEDHDLDEIRSLEFFGKKYDWNPQVSGPVGRISTHTLKPFFEEISSLFERDIDAKQLTDILIASAQCNNLSESTSFFYQKVFGPLGLIVLNPDEAALKQLFKPIIQKDIIEKAFGESLKNQTEKLKQKGYEPQVLTKEINHFYMNSEGRFRIEEKEEGFTTIQGGQNWTRAEMEQEIEAFPERFSPNVCLRPMYQETVLPNLIYVGGPAEVAYWGQLQQAFDKASIPMPMVFQRHSFVLLNNKTRITWNQFHLDDEALWQSLAELEKWFLTDKVETKDFTLVNQQLADWFEQLNQFIDDKDLGLKQSLEGFKVKTKEGLETFFKKLEKSEKTKFDQELNKLRKAYEWLHPKDMKQERVVSLLSVASLVSSFSELIEFMSQSDQKGVIAEEIND